MQNKKTQIIIADFYAYDMKHQKSYIDKTESEVLQDLKSICSTYHLMSLTFYESYLIESKIFNTNKTFKK
jgi:hypothetical protein